MERRRETRVPADLPVELTVLGSNEGAGPAQVIEISGHGLQLVVHRPVPINAAVKVDGDDWLMLGEVCYCRQEGLQYVVGLQIDQSLHGLKKLAELNENLLSTERSTERPRVLASR